jgi:malate dehydrogenase (oxaloacetate-decarboxylating)
MAPDAVVFACANPTPEIWPWEARDAGARIVGTGRSDFPNQVNNALVFPGIFRGALDVRARTISDEMAIAAAHELARCAECRGLHEEHILPTLDEWEVPARIAAVVGTKAQEQGLARRSLSREQIHAHALETIRQARSATQLLMREGLIAAVPREA